MFLLRVLAGERVVETHHCQGRVTVVGRDAECDVTLAHAGVSRRHAAITLDDGDHMVEDLGSTNGVVVSGARIRRRRRLLHGDVIELGTARIEFSTRLAMPTGRESSVEAPAAASEYLALKGSKVYHLPGCGALSGAKAGRLERFGDARRARASGRRPCGKCLPKGAGA